MIKPHKLAAYRLLHDGMLAFTRAEHVGMRIDVAYCERKRDFLTKKIVHLQEQLKKTNFVKHWIHFYKDKFNLSSNHQLSRILYDVKKIPPSRLTASGKGSTDDRALLDLNIPELNDLLEIRKLTKIRDTYLDAFVREQVNGVVHPFFNLHTVRTYRSSSDRPNFQNIPKRDKEAMKICRRAILPRPGHQLMEADYSGIEVRISACYHKDRTMLEYINDPRSDMHLDMAKQIFLMPDMVKGGPAAVLRNAAKNGFVFPQFYGDYYKNCANYLVGEWGKLPQATWKAGQGISIGNGVTLSDHLIANGIKSFDKFVEHLQKIEDHFWKVRFKEYQQWKEVLWNKYQKVGYIDLLTGFRCGGVMSKNDVTNYPIQGSAFHCLLWSFIELDKIAIQECWDTKLIGQIHDAILLDVYPPELDHVVATVKRVACDELRKVWKWIITPLDVDVDVCEVNGSWADKNSYE